MRTSIPYAALAVALAAGATAANAQTVISRQISNQPVETIVTEQPVTTVQTTRRVSVARPVVHRRVVTTRRTTITQRILPRTTVTTVPPPLADTTMAAEPAPLYDVAPAAEPIVAVPPPVMAPPPRFATTPAPLYDEVVAPAAPAVPVATTIPTYRYVYEPDRILVIDPSTNIAIQALPR
jgi:hypothetical protein